MYPAYAGAEKPGITEIPESLIQDVAVTREALSFILEHHSSAPGTSWFLCASYGRPHSPLTASERYIRRHEGRLPPAAVTDTEGLETYGRRFVRDLTDERWIKGREAYYACVDFVDDCIGELLDRIDASAFEYDPTSTDGCRRYAPSATYWYGVRINYKQTVDNEPAAAWRCVRDERWKYVEIEKDDTLLFDTKNDRLETRNLTGEVEHQARYAEMREWVYKNTILRR